MLPMQHRNGRRGSEYGELPAAQDGDAEPEAPRGKVESGLRRWPVQVACCAVLLCAAAGTFVYRRLYLAPGHGDVAVLRPSGVQVLAAELPQPPVPYSYSDFMQWLRTSDFSRYPTLKWTPEVAEFDLDAATKGKFAPWLEGPFAEEALSAAKAVNKYSFFEEVMRSGNLGIVGSPGIHLYVLRRLLEAAEGQAHPTFLDAGCGPGYLLMAWAIAAGDGSRAVGIDIDPAVVEAAKKHLKNPAAWDHKNGYLPNDAKLEAFVGDALHPDGPAMDLELGSVDAVNLGLAVDEDALADDLAPLAAYLRPGGLMAAPICIRDQPKDMPSGKCAARFEILRRREDGSLERQPGDPDIPVRFIRALKPGETTGPVSAPAKKASSGRLNR